MEAVNVPFTATDPVNWIEAISNNLKTYIQDRKAVYL